jgi:release factor glutamine methyltransferase
MTLAQRLAQGRVALTASGVASDEAAVDVDVFAREILEWDRAVLLTQLRAEVPAALEPRFSAWVTRRQRGEPTAYIVGSREFWGLSFRVTPAVLIPRPETELIVEEALERLDAGSRVRVADVGTGSGCLAVTIAHSRPSCTVVASDVSADALAVARSNALLHRVEDRVRFVHTSYLDGVDEQFDVIVANPPYVRSGDRPALGRSVRHEPDVALFGGDDGLAHISALLDRVPGALTAGGWFLMEFGYGQEQDVRRLVDDRAALNLSNILMDLQGIPRVAVVKTS